MKSDVRTILLQAELRVESELGGRGRYVFMYDVLVIKTDLNLDITDVFLTEFKVQLYKKIF